MFTFALHLGGGGAIACWRKEGFGMPVCSLDKTIPCSSDLKTLMLSNTSNVFIILGSCKCLETNK